MTPTSQESPPPGLNLEEVQRILVVDDQWPNIQLVGAVLGDFGHEIIAARNGAEALEKIRLRAPDLILLDMIMPGTDGCELCRQIRQTAEGGQIPVIFISVSDDKELIVRALAAGGVDYITKPFNSAELLWRVRAQLALKSTRDDLQKLAEEKDELLGMLAHDLKSLLGGINLSADLARDRLGREGNHVPEKLAAEIFETSTVLLAFAKRFLAAANVEFVAASGTNRASGPQPARILIIDDQPENIRLAGAVLGRLGHEIIPATDGETAVRRAALKEPDIILLDLLMPEIDGFETCRRLRAAPETRDTPIIFLSSAGDKDFVVRALAAGGVDYLTKPFHSAELTMRVETHLSLKFAKNRLERLARTRVQLLGLLARDCKQQLESMFQNARLLQKLTEGKDHRTEQLADNIQRSTAQLVDFVGDFRDLAADGKHLALHPAPMSFFRVATRTLKRYIEAARVKDVRLELDPPPASDEDFVLADERAVHRVLDNLVSNAVKFSPPKTVVRLSVRPTERQVQCQVADQGPGFTVEDKARMFRRFGRLSARPTGGEPSSGLGLSIVRKLIRAMNGDVTCQSDPGCGAVFTIGLPRSAAGASQT